MQPANSAFNGGLISKLPAALHSLSLYDVKNKTLVPYSHYIHAILAREICTFYAFNLQVLPVLLACKGMLKKVSDAAADLIMKCHSLEFDEQPYRECN